MLRHAARRDQCKDKLGEAAVLTRHTGKRADYKVQGDAAERERMSTSTSVQCAGFAAEVLIEALAARCYITAIGSHRLPKAYPRSGWHRKARQLLAVGSDNEAS